MHRAPLICATVVLTAAGLTACSSGSDDDGRLRDPARGTSPDEGARTLLDRRGSGDFATRLDIPRGTEAVRISVSCAPSGTWKAALEGVGGGEGDCRPHSDGGVDLGYEGTGRQDLTFEAPAGRRWWVVVTSISHAQSP